MDLFKKSCILLIATSSFAALSAQAETEVTIQDNIPGTQIVAQNSQIQGSGIWAQQPANSPAVDAYYAAAYASDWPGNSPYATTATYNVEDNYNNVLATCTVNTSVIGNAGKGTPAPNPNSPYYYYGTCTNNYHLTYVSGYSITNPHYVFELNNGGGVMQGPAWPT